MRNSISQIFALVLKSLSCFKLMITFSPYLLNLKLSSKIGVTVFRCELQRTISPSTIIVTPSLPVAGLI